MSQDRLKTAARAIAGLDPMVPYRYLYRAQVIGQSASNLDQVDVRPDDPALPEMAGVPLRHGIPGVQAQVQPGCHVVVGWANGEPDAPFAALWEPGASVTKLIVNGVAIQLGDSSASQHPFHGEDLSTDLAKVLAEISADLVAVFAAASAGTPTSTADVAQMVRKLEAGLYLSTKVTTT